jgi:hypothetical protein
MDTSPGYGHLSDEIAGVLKLQGSACDNFQPDIRAASTLSGRYVLQQPHERFEVRPAIGMPHAPQ